MQSTKYQYNSKYSNRCIKRKSFLISNSFQNFYFAHTGIALWQNSQDFKDGISPMGRVT